MKYCNDALTHHYGGKSIRLDPVTLVPKFKDKKDVANMVTDKFEEIFTAASSLISYLIILIAPSRLCLA